MLDQVQLSLGCYVPTAETHVQVRCKGHAIFLHSIAVCNGPVRQSDSQGLSSCRLGDYALASHSADTILQQRRGLHPSQVTDNGHVMLSDHFDHNQLSSLSFPTATRLPNA